MRQLLWWKIPSSSPRLSLAPLTLKWFIGWCCGLFRFELGNGEWSYQKNPCLKRYVGPDHMFCCVSVNCVVCKENNSFIHWNWDLLCADLKLLSHLIRWWAQEILRGEPQQISKCYVCGSQIPVSPWSNIISFVGANKFLSWRERICVLW